MTAPQPMLQIGETHEQYMARMHDWASSGGAAAPVVAVVEDDAPVIDETDTTFLEQAP